MRFTPFPTFAQLRKYDIITNYIWLTPLSHHFIQNFISCLVILVFTKPSNHGIICHRIRFAATFSHLLQKS
uniref:Pentatricopeptide repeat-containing family protein n=1 Tax=Rhizophora mucronata TaxID=61149 RepID=A0A2P2NZX9_RHIMU